MHGKSFAWYLEEPIYLNLFDTLMHSMLPYNLHNICCQAGVVKIFCQWLLWRPACREYTVCEPPIIGGNSASYQVSANQFVSLREAIKQKKQISYGNLP